MQSNTFCASCYRAVGNIFVKCIICCGYYHKSCSCIESDEFLLIKSSKNVLYCCNKCVDASQDMIAKVSDLSNQIIELKNLFIAYVNENNAKESALPKKEKTRAKPNLSKQQRGRSPLRPSLSSNCNTLLISKPVIADHDANVVPTELTANKLNSKMRVRRESFCLSDDSINNAANVVVSTEPTISNGNEMKSNMRIRRPSLCNSQYSDAHSNAATENSKEKIDIPAKNLEWINVTSKRNRKRAIYGDNNNEDLEVIADKKWIHLSSFKPTVTEDQIVNYVAKYAKIGKNHIKCYKLVKKGVDLNDLKRLSFKIGITDVYYTEVFNTSLWPANVKVRPFTFFK